MVSFVWALGIWFAGEGVGMLFTGTASPLTGAPGAALLYILAGLLCWPRKTATRPAPDSPERGLLGERWASVLFSAIWLGSAVLWLLPANSGAGVVHDAIASAHSGAGWLSGVLDAASTATAGQGTTIAITLAIASEAIGLAVMYGALSGFPRPRDRTLSAVLGCWPGARRRVHRSGRRCRQRAADDQ